MSVLEETKVHIAFVIQMNNFFLLLLQFLLSSNYLLPRFRMGTVGYYHKDFVENMKKKREKRR